MQESVSLTDRKRAAIVQAAVLEFEESGFQATSMDVIAARAHVSKRTVYNHFASKELLFKEISGCVCKCVSEVTNLAFDPSRTVRDQLMEIARAELSLMTSKDFMTMARVTLTEHMRSPEMASEAFQRLKRGENGTGRWIRQAVDAGKLKAADPLVASRQFSSLLKEFALWPQFFGGEPMPGEAECAAIAESTVAMFLDHYGAG